MRRIIGFIMIFIFIGCFCQCSDKIDNTLKQAEQIMTDNYYFPKPLEFEDIDIVYKLFFINTIE